jgi:hypothetical protein
MYDWLLMFLVEIVEVPDQGQLFCYLF